MNPKSFLLVFFVTLGLNLVSWAQKSCFVAAPSGLICRTAPSLTAERIGRLPYGSIVTIVEITTIQEEAIENEQEVPGAWVKVRYYSYPYVVHSDPEAQHSNECYVYSSYLRLLKRAEVKQEEIKEDAFKLVQSKKRGRAEELEKITDFDEIKAALVGRVTWRDLPEEVYGLIMDSLILENGRVLVINERSNDYGVVAYFPSEEILLFYGGHSSDFAISVATGEELEMIGNPEYIIESPNKKVRLAGYFPGQECDAYSFQEFREGRWQFLTNFGSESEVIGWNVCQFIAFYWIDDSQFVFSYLDYLSGSEQGEIRYFKGEIVGVLSDYLPVPMFRDSVSQSTNFVHWVTSSLGDLNGDGRMDFARVMQDTVDETRPYQLEIYFSDEQGNFVRVSETLNAVPEELPNGHHTPHYGFSSVYIQEGILHVEVGLLRGRFEHRFRYQNDEFELIGYTRHESDGFGKLIYTDFNLLTGKRLVEIEFYSSDQPKEVNVETIRINPLPNLENIGTSNSEWY